MPIAPCEACNSQKYHTRQWVYDKNKRLISFCSDCQHIPMTPTYDDVYLGGHGGIQTDPNIVHPKTGIEIPFQTKQDKAVAMRIAGVKQAASAERHHGFRNESHLHRKKYFEVS